jgi:hyperosmotically inducible protein
MKILIAAISAAGLMAAQTADQQTNTKQDRQMTAQIRKALMQDSALSTNAHNVKIITQGGMVTLKGIVNSDNEKKVVESKAADVAGGVAKVDDELTVK